jgi:hypothetical protein
MNNANNNIFSIEELSNFTTYKCNISESFIMYEINNKTLTINNSYFNWEYPKLIMNLLMYSFNNIIEKNKLENFIYTILKQEYNLLDKTKWNIIKEYDDSYDLECPIDIALENVLYGFVLG